MSIPQLLNNKELLKSSIPDIFFSILKEHSGNTGVQAEKRSICYSELNTCSNQISWFLETIDSKNRRPVVLLFNDRVNEIISLLGVLKTGSFFVSVDPSLPESRMENIVNQFDSPVIITEEKLLVGLSFIEKNANVIVPVEEIISSSYPVSDFRREIPSDTLACIIFTSGTTGQPKGVMHSHQNLIHLVMQQTKDFQLTKEDRFSLLSASLHIAGLSDILRALLNGASIHSYNVKEQGIVHLADWLINEKITVIHTVPTLFRYLTDIIKQQHQFNDLRLIHLGGGRLIAGDIERYKKFFSDSCILVNNLGCTELSSFRHYFFNKETEIKEDSVPAGYPVEDKDILICDREGKPVKGNVKGEIVLKSRYLALGYWKNPKLTSEAFSSEPGTGCRYYKTGDLGRISADRCLHYLGRKDSQLKIRGYRVELLEIERVLFLHPGVKDAVVLDEKNEKNQMRLSAYIIPQKKARAVISRKHRQVLPNDLAVLCQNKYELDHLYTELFDKKAYFQHGIQLPKKGVILDIGANIGLFSIFVNLYSPKTEIYSFEPVTPIFNILKANTELYGNKIKTLNYGISSREGTANFIYYKNITTMSGIKNYINEDEDKEVIKRHILHDIHSRSENLMKWEESMSEIVNNRMQKENLKCQLRTVSNIIKQEKIEEIALLKIDVQRAELDVLKGIKGKDWNRVQQVVMELHDKGPKKRRIKFVTQLLKKHHFKITIDQDPIRKKTDRYNVYAYRDDNSSESGKNIFDMPDVSKERINHAQIMTPEKLRKHMENILPLYAIPGFIHIVEEFPLTQSGKVDRRKLSQTVIEQWEKKEIERPNTDTEKFLVGLWSDIMKIKRISIADNFFDLGGDSLMSVQMLGEINSFFMTDLRLPVIFEFSTIKELAQLIDRKVLVSHWESRVPEEGISEAVLDEIKKDRARLGKQGMILPDLIINYQKKLVSSWKGVRLKPDSLIVGKHVSGQRIPLFWCFQGYYELELLSEHVSTDQPVYGMRSGNQIFKNNDFLTEYMASYYVSEIVKIHSRGPLIIGGNCQGGNIAWVMAEKLLSMGRDVALLCLMELNIKKTYPGRIAMFFGRESTRHNPYLYDKNPEFYWDKCYRFYTSDILDGAHGKFFIKKNIADLSLKLMNRMDEVQREYCGIPPLANTPLRFNIPLLSFFQNILKNITKHRTRTKKNQ